MRINFAANASNEIKLKRVKELLELTPSKRRTKLRSMGRKVRKNSRARMKAQKNIDGSAYAARKDGTNKKMFAKMGKGLIVKTTDSSVEINWAYAGTGKIAAEHQAGFNEVYTAEKAEKKYGREDYKDPSTRKQAKALLAEGFKVRRKMGKKQKSKWVRPTIGWIEANIKKGRAGLILKTMRDTQPKKKWSVQLAKRTLLGATDKEVNQMVEELFS
jgi:phage virion morphogenesis protein